MSIKLSDLKENESFENGLKTKMYVDKGNTMVRLTSETYNHNKFQEFVPFDTLSYWYPLYFYYDWSYNSARNLMIMKYLPNAPASFKKFLKDNPHFNFKDCVDLETNQGIQDNNRIFLDNFELINQFKDMGLHTWDDYFNDQDVKENFVILDQLLQTIWSEAYRIEQGQASSEEVINTDEFPVNINSKEPYDTKVLKYLTDQDKVLLIRIGCAEVMTMKMSDAVRARME